MKRRKYYLHQRNGIFYAELVDQTTGRKLSARSTGEADRDAALLKVAEWLRDGLPVGRTHKLRPLSVAFDLDAICKAIKKTPLDGRGAEQIVSILKDRGLIVGNFTKAGPSSVRFLDFLENAWDMEKSAWLKEKSAYGHSITKRHCIESLGVVKRYWDRPGIRDVLLVDLGRSAIKSHLLSIHEEGLSPSTVNKALAAVSAPLAWAAREKLIPENPAEGIPRFTGVMKTRDILTKDEIEVLAALDWPDERARAAFFVALTCGLRLSEIQALQTQDIVEDRLLVRQSWSWADGLTCLKNKESREVKILPEVRDILRVLLSENPHGRGGENFVFFGVKPDQPLDTKVLTDGYFSALHQIGIDEKVRKDRNLVFHGLRHNYATALAERVTEAQAMKSTGHKTAAMFAHYSAHQTEESLTAVGNAVDQAFGQIVKFKKAVGI